MTSFPRLRPLWLIVVLLAVMMSASALLAAPRQALYSGSIVETHTNCGLTQVFGIVLDANGNHMSGTNIRLWWGGGPTLRTTAGKYGSAGASGWDFSLNTQPVANSWYVAVDDGGDIVLSDQIEVRTSGTCNSGDVNVVKVEIRHTPDGGGSSDSGGGNESPPPASNPAPSNTEAAPPLTANASCVWYTETAGGSGGFSVCDDDNARFYTAFAQYGLQNVGYPISQRFKRDGFITQAFQKGVFQWRADSTTVAFVNVFDELHNRNLDQPLLETRQTPNQLPDGWDGGASFEEVKQRRQALLNQRPALYSAYFSVSDPLLFFGLPTSEVQDMGNHYAIRLQRAVLQEWKENVPWASIGQVTVANGGDIAKEMNHFDGSILTPESSPPAGASAGSPSSPQPTPAPADPQPTQPPADPQPSASTPGGFGYGIQAHMIYLDKAQIYGWTNGLGFNWIKQQIEWKAWEGSQGNIDWGEMDAIIDGAVANNITMLFSTVGAPSWAREAGYDSSVAGPPQDPNTFADFNAAVAARYCDKGLGAIEVWNEQNLHYEWGNKPLNPADYMTLLRPSYTAIKAACPSMIVVSGALTPAGNVGSLAIDDFSYLEGMLQNGLLNYADTIGAHPSGFNVPPSLNHTQACAYIQQQGASFMGPCDSPHHSWSFRSTVDGYYDMIQNHGGGKLIWATEFGWAAGGAFHPSYAYANDNSYDEQAAWTVEAYQYMRDSGKVGAAFLWNLNFRIVADQTEKAQWGILRNDGSPLPAYGALQAMPK